MSDAVNTLLTKMFTVNELTTSSVMGVATVKGKKPSLDPERRAIVECKLVFFLLHVNQSVYQNLPIICHTCYD